jgi:hypothetical protein
MSLSTLPGYHGYVASKVSSFNKEAISKLTDSNHLSSLWMSEPQAYDKKVISIYTATHMYANDFQQLLDQSTPFVINSNSDSFQWMINAPFKFPKIIFMTEETEGIAKPGLDGQEFTIVADRKEFSKGDVITSQKFEQSTPLYIVKDPTPFNTGWLYTVTILSDNPKVDFIQKNFLQPGTELIFLYNLVGEFTQELTGLGSQGDQIKLYDQVGSGFGIEQTITSWADARSLKDKDGNPLDIMVYGSYDRRNALPERKIMDVRWEPYAETLMRRKMYEMKTDYMIWGRPGTAKDHGSRQEIKRSSAGVYHRMINNGNVAFYNKGEFNISLLRSVFGDLFYRRVSIKDRKVKIYTNEAGFELFKQATKEDLLKSGLTIIADDRFIQGSGQNMVINYAFSSFITSDTGQVTLSHLRQLDVPSTNLEFGQNKKSPPIFMVFDVSPTGDGTPQNNIRQVRIAGQPSMTWGYAEGRRHHLGFAASQGMSSSSMFPGYKIWMEDRTDVFIEDLSKTVIIKEIPAY